MTACQWCSERPCVCPSAPCSDCGRLTLLGAGESGAVVTVCAGCQCERWVLEGWRARGYVPCNCHPECNGVMPARQLVDTREVSV
jgi:hypothetical protein